MARFGYTERDMSERSDRFVDALIAWGDEDQIAARVRTHHDGGADSVLIHPIPTSSHTIVSQLELLAPSLLPRR